MRSLAFITVLVATTALGQWEVPVPLVLTGPSAADAQVLGLAHPLQADAAMSVDAARTSAATYTSAVGPVYSASLVPPASSYAAGMVITLVPQNDCVPTAQIDVDGLGPRDIVEQGGLPLDTADLKAGVPVRMVYDGARFVLLGSTYIPCPAGYSVGGRTFCIEDSVSAVTTFYQAVDQCTARNARLCGYNEWVLACERVPGFLATVVDYEWIDDAANNLTDAKIIGNGGDGSTGTTLEIGCRRGGSSAPTLTWRFRCCRTR